MKKAISLIALALASVCCLSAQNKARLKFDYDISIGTSLDNREYDRTPLDQSRTLFGVRAELGLGARVEQGRITHRILAGADPCMNSEEAGRWSPYFSTSSACL